MATNSHGASDDVGQVGTGVAVDEEGPAEGGHADQRGHRQQHRGPGPQPDGGTCGARAASALASPCQGGAHLVDGEPRVGGQHLGHLRGEDRRVAHHVACRPVGDDLALGQYHRPVGHLGHQLDVVGGQHHGVAPSAASCRTTATRRSLLG